MCCNSENVLKRVLNFHLASWMSMHEGETIYN